MPNMNRCSRWSNSTSGLLDLFSFVSLLLTKCCPTAILGFVISIIINSVDRMLRRGTLAHVGKEIGEFSPPFANFDSSATIVFIRFLRGKITSTQHRIPHRIFGHSAANHSGHPVLGIALSRFPSGFKAATTFCVSSSETFSANDNLFAAITQTKPCGPYSLGLHCTSLDEALCRQTPESLFSKILVCFVFMRTFLATVFGTLKGTSKHAFAF